ncbi:MAG: RluA family pseudouridine synthase [Treponema sp.]|jgi:23S rRNA pseudouridine1911/1915/1917 synthase|nr:RluA family pseudouridine synthase [Treponema sp.]
MKQAAPFSVIYEDDYIIAVNKSSGIAVSPDRWDDSKDRLDKLVGSSLGDRRIFTVHRIDRDTSGVVVFAKDEATHRFLSQAFEGRQVQKRYTALVHGRPVWKETDCDLALVPNGNKLHHTTIDKYHGKKSLTRFRFILSAGNYSVIDAMPETGRTHQIRVHLASLGHPVVCDPLYGTVKPILLSSFKRNWRGDPFEEKPLLDRLGLHAAELTIPSPVTTETLTLEAPVQRDMAAMIKQLEKIAGKRVEGQGQ